MTIHDEKPVSVTDEIARLIVRSYSIRTFRTFPSPDEIVQIECALKGTVTRDMADVIIRAFNDGTPVSVLPGTWTVPPKT